MPVVKCLNVHNYCHLLSDAHNPVTLELNLSTSVAKTIYQNSMSSRTRLWDASKADIYKANCDQRNVNYLMSSLLELENRESVQQSDVDTIIETLNKMFLVATEEIFGYSNIRNDNSNVAHKPTWYGYQCRKMRRKWHSAKYVYKFNKNEVNKVALNRASKEYKKTMRQSYIKFKRFNIKKLKNMKSTNPKMYWKIINGGKQDAVQASVENLLSYFKAANNKHISDSNDPTFETLDNERTNDYINRKITLAEIEN